jgi:hypothetical protein
MGVQKGLGAGDDEPNHNEGHQPRRGKADSKGGPKHVEPELLSRQLDHLAERKAQGGTAQDQA